MHYLHAAIASPLTRCHCMLMNLDDDDTGKIIFILINKFFKHLVGIMTDNFSFVASSYYVSFFNDDDVEGLRKWTNTTRQKISLMVHLKEEISRNSHSIFSSVFIFTGWANLIHSSRHLQVSALLCLNKIFSYEILNFFTKL